MSRVSRARLKIEKTTRITSSEYVPRGDSKDAILARIAVDRAAIDLPEFSGEQEVSPGAIDQVGEHSLIAGKGCIVAQTRCLIGAPQFMRKCIVQGRTDVGLER